jgi:hypothetical protein
MFANTSSTQAHPNPHMHFQNKKGSDQLVKHCTFFLIKDVTPSITFLLRLGKVKKAELDSEIKFLL